MGAVARRTGAGGPLKSQGLEINPRKLRAWRTGIHSTRYAEIQRDHAPRIEAERIGTAREIVLAANAATLEAIEATRDQVSEGEAKDPSAVARNLQTVAGIATDKALLTEGRPTIVHGSDSVEALVARMNRLLGITIEPAVDSTAEDDTPAELEG
jgi:hypothetical protein